MKIKFLQIKDFRSFESTGQISLDQINVFVGANNTGKSTILKAIHLMQEGCNVAAADIRVGAKEARVVIGLSEADDFYRTGRLLASAKADPTLRISVRRGATPIATISMDLWLGVSKERPDADLIAGREPDHFIVPYLSKRKTSAYQDDVRDQQVTAIHPNMSFLSAKVSRISNRTFPGHEYYNEACEAILGFSVGVVPVENGQRAGVYLLNGERLLIDQMGEGVANIVALLAELTVSKGKLFLIEEPENDLHPKALKALLDLILESSKTNQFVISTHSNIVVRHLAGADNSLLYSVVTDPRELPPKAQIVKIDRTPGARLEMLRELGYSFSDFDLWDGWLILEEASAERIIRSYLIPMFAAGLTRVRTLAAGGNSKVAPVFEDFYRLALFTHLEQAYKNTAWVRIDGDAEGERIIGDLQKRFSGWHNDRFAVFKQAQFEHYYPEEFKEAVATALSIEDKLERKEAKRALLLSVCEWLEEDPKRARIALEKSAAEIIKDLQRIESQLDALRGNVRSTTTLGVQ